VRYYAYILISLVNVKRKYYYGSTENLEKRLELHNAGKVKSTKSGRPWKLHYIEEYSTRTEAASREYFFKSIEGYRWLKDNNITKGEAPERPKGPVC
jgi:putative endonuclease